MATRQGRSKNYHMARTLRKARSEAINRRRHPDTYRGRNTATRPCGCRKTGKVCPACGARMRGPWWEGDAQADYRVWYCPRCGHRCERFAWEVEPEKKSDPLATAVRLAR